jgi:acetyl esterase/lipase
MDIMRRRFRLLSLSLLFALASCSPVRVLKALVPDDGYRRVADLPYGEKPRQKLDLYLPAGGSAGRPVVVFFYGGNWQSGERRDYLFVGEALAARGFVVAVPDYRVHPEAGYVDFLRDGAAAVRWVRAHVAQHGGDPDRVFVMGHSAGAYIAAMLALDDRWLGAERRHLRGLIGLAGPYDFLPLTGADYRAIFAPDQDSRSTQPIEYADASSAPAFLASGADDTTVLPANSRRLAAKLRAAGVKVEDKYYEGAGHLRIVGALAAPLRFLAPVLDDVSRFLNREASATRRP